ALLARIHDLEAQAVEGGMRLQLDGAAIDYLIPEVAAASYGHDIALSPDGADRNVAIEFTTSSLAATRNALAGIPAGPMAGDAAKLLVPASFACGAALVFCANAAAT